MISEETAREYLHTGRDSAESVKALAARVSASCEANLLESMPEPAMMLNRFRQVLWMNASCSELIRGLNHGSGTGAGTGLASAVGLRPGELLGCAYATLTEGGCGTTEFCHFCGTATAIVNALQKREGIEHCVIQRGQGAAGEPLHLDVWSRPLAMGNEDVVLVMMRDMSGEARRQVLERVFYHDVGNTLSGIKSVLELMHCDRDPEDKCWMELLRSATDQLVEEIESQRSTRSSDGGQLEPVFQPVDIRSLAVEAARLFRYSLYSRELNLVWESGNATPLADTDPVLFRRCVVNMLKNAIEASERGQRIRIGVDEDEGSAIVRVWNASAMSDEVQLRVFQHSFSTKGRGRGLGAYSLKLLAERYLHGRVWFTSSAEEGTLFTLSVPKARLP